MKKTLCALALVPLLMVAVLGNNPAKADEASATMARETAQMSVDFADMTIEAMDEDWLQMLFAYHFGPGGDTFTSIHARSLDLIYVSSAQWPHGNLEWNPNISEWDRWFLLFMRSEIGEDPNSENEALNNIADIEKDYKAEHTRLKGDFEAADILFNAGNWAVAQTAFERISDDYLTASGIYDTLWMTYSDQGWMALTDLEMMCDWLENSWP